MGNGLKIKEKIPRTHSILVHNHEKKEPTAYMPLYMPNTSNEEIKKILMKLVNGNG